MDSGISKYEATGLRRWRHPLNPPENRPPQKSKVEAMGNFRLESQLAIYCRDYPSICSRERTVAETKEICATLWTCSPEAKCGCVSQNERGRRHQYGRIEPCGDGGIDVKKSRLKCENKLFFGIFGYFLTVYPYCSLGSSLL